MYRRWRPPLVRSADLIDAPFLPIRTGLRRWRIWVTDRLSALFGGSLLCSTADSEGKTRTYGNGTWYRVLLFKCNICLGFAHYVEAFIRKRTNFILTCTCSTSVHSQCCLESLCMFNSISTAIYSTVHLVMTSICYECQRKEIQASACKRRELVLDLPRANLCRAWYI